MLSAESGENVIANMKEAHRESKYGEAMYEAWGRDKLTEEHELYEEQKIIEPYIRT